MTEPPFEEVDQLNTELVLSKDPGQDWMLRCTNAVRITLPGQPRVQLDPESVKEYLAIDLLTPELNKLAPHLWLVSTPRSSHISPLHHQAVRGRSIVVAENPQLHLVWANNQIFVKPLPKYLLSHAFWHYYLTSARSPLPHPLRADAIKAALGFIRTYSYLIRHETDFRLAQREEYCLIPADVTWTRFARFIAAFESIDNELVSPRYAYGELRLTRLNFYTRIFLFPKLTFHHIHAQWRAFFENFVAPLLVIFVILSLVLNAMQVELAAQGPGDVGSSWASFASVCRWASVCALLFMAIITMTLISLFTFFFLHDIYFARRVLREERSRGPMPTFQQRMKSGVV
jgi:hypothetical protein